MVLRNIETFCDVTCWRQQILMRVISETKIQAVSPFIWMAPNPLRPVKRLILEGKDGARLFFVPSERQEAVGASWNLGDSVWSLLGYWGCHWVLFTYKGDTLCIIFLVALAYQNASAKTCVLRRVNFANYWSGNMGFSMSE